MRGVGGKEKRLSSKRLNKTISPADERVTGEKTE